VSRVFRGSRRDSSPMFDIDTFVADCITARGEAEPRRAVKDVLAGAVSRPADLANALRPQRASIDRLHVSPELTILNVVWAPGMSFRPHNHRMWAVIGIYTGGEDNTFYRRASGAGLVESGGKALRPRDTCVLGDDAIHAVTNSTAMHAGAIHIYGGDFFATPRSEWDPATFEERPYDVDTALRYFEECNKALDVEATR
jgi:predicted metal-dependent enzyme (double-stranded beta helix superfamily)